MKGANRLIVESLFVSVRIMQIFVKTLTGKTITLEVSFMYYAKRRMVLSEFIS